MLLSAATAGNADTAAHCVRCVQTLRLCVPRSRLSLGVWTCAVRQLRQLAGPPYESRSTVQGPQSTVQGHHHTWRRKLHNRPQTFRSYPRVSGYLCGL
jgi:hypothetical protein